MNVALDNYEEERNARFQEIAAQVIAARAKLIYLEQQMTDAYIGTTVQLLEEVQKELFRYYWNDEPPKEIQDDES